ncbi:phospholipid scramblase 2-like isoform X2 [Choristoneura fumiferana]|uniref:phospholipid scramblase 2-like isoform X2 n=1 Tax=Choristoneura fumiferana TaxID=7141 RepID=UPI003D155648
MLASPIPLQTYDPLPDVKAAVPGTDTEALLEPVKDSTTQITTLNSQQETESPILQELETVDQLLITKRLHVKSVLLLRGKRSRYVIKSDEQNLIYTVDEETSWWIGYLCYGLRPLRLRVLNEQGVEVMRIIRPYACTTRVLPCQLQTMKVYSPPGSLLGTIEQQWSPVKPVYVIKNTEGADLFWLRGPLMTVSLFKDVEFEMCRPDGTYVGSTRKRWQGLTHALLFATIRDRFGVAFERDLTPREKALLLAMTLLVDYMYYDT